MDPDLPDEKDQYIVRFKHGDFFGELGMVMGIPRTATVIADKMSLLITLRKAEFHTFLRYYFYNLFASSYQSSLYFWIDLFRFLRTPACMSGKSINNMSYNRFEL